MHMALFLIMHVLMNGCFQTLLIYIYIHTHGLPYLWQHEFKEKLHMCTLGHTVSFMFYFYSKYVYFTLQ